LSTDFAPLTTFTICSAFAFVAAELTLPVKTARGFGTALLGMFSLLDSCGVIKSIPVVWLSWFCWLFNDQFGPALTDSLGVNTHSLKSLTQ